MKYSWQLATLTVGASNTEPPVAGFNWTARLSIDVDTPNVWSVSLSGFSAGLATIESMRSEIEVEVNKALALAQSQSNLSADVDAILGELSKEQVGTL